MLFIHLFYGVHFAYGSYTGEQILLFVLEIPHSLLLLCKHQCVSHSGVELVHYK